MRVIRGPYKCFSTSFPGIEGGENVVFENYLATVSDFVADLILERYPGSYFCERIYDPGPKDKVLIVRDLGLGDLLLITPTIRALRASGVGQVDVATKRHLAPVLEGNPHVGKIMILEDLEGLPSQDYHAVIDLRLYVEHAENSQLYRNRAVAFGLSASLDLSGDELLMDYFVSDAEKAWAKATIATRAEMPGAATVGLVWRTSTKNRTWAESRVRAVCAALVASNYRVLVFDHEMQNLGAGNSLVGNCTGKDSIRQTAALIDACDVVIAPDSGLFHIASALRKPIVAYFGAFPIEERQTSRNITMLPMSAGPCHFKPCRKYQCMNFVADETSRCIATDPQAVVDHVRIALDHGDQPAFRDSVPAANFTNVGTTGNLPINSSDPKRFRSVAYDTPPFFR